MSTTNDRYYDILNQSTELVRRYISQFSSDEERKIALQTLEMNVEHETSVIENDTMVETV